MAKLFSERIKRTQEEDGLQVPGNIRLRLDKNTILQPHFKAILTRREYDFSEIADNDAAEGNFTIEDISLAGDLKGAFVKDEEVTPDAEIDGRTDYEVIPADESIAVFATHAEPLPQQQPGSNQLTPLTEEALIVPGAAGTFPEIRSVSISKSGFVSGSNVAFKPVTFKANVKPVKKTTGKLYWLIYKEHSSDTPIYLETPAVDDKTFTYDFSTLPEGKYRVEVYGAFSAWHEKKGEDRGGNKIKPKTKKAYAFVNVESKSNMVTKLNSPDFVTNASTKKKEVNWGVDVKFDASLLFGIEEDIGQVEWAMKTGEGTQVMTEFTEAAKGKPFIILNFPKPEGNTDYTLEATMNGTTRTQLFTVVEKTFVKNIKLESNMREYVYNEQKTLSFKVSKYTQSKANTEDIQNTKWVRMFFPGLHREDYDSKNIKLTVENGEVKSAIIGKTKAELESFQGSDAWNIEAGIFDSAKKDKYKKGLYIVEAYTGKPDGKTSSEYSDMVFYEVARNEVQGISGRKVIRPSAGDEMFKYSIVKWRFGDAKGEEKNVNWTLYDENTAVKTFEKGSEVQVYYDKAGTYTLRAWVEDKDKAASFQVKIEEPKIVKSFIADSTGKKITRSGFDDKVYIYMKTEGLQEETLQVGLFEYDSFSGVDFLQSTDTVVNSSGVIFQEISLKKDNIVKQEGNENAEIYPVITMPADSKIKLTNSSFQRERIHYYTYEGEVLRALYGKQSIDYDFTDTGGTMIQTVVLYGTKVKVRIKLANRHDEQVNIAIMEGGNTYKFQKLITGITVNDEGYAEAEFEVPVEWSKDHKGKDTDVRYFFPVLYENEALNYIDPSKKKSKMLKVAKVMPSGDELQGIDFEQVEYAELERDNGENRVPASIKLAWGNKIDNEFALKVMEVSQRIQCDPNDLMAVMAVETAKTFWPYRIEGRKEETHPGQSEVTEADVKGHAVGLIQFTKGAIEGINTYLNTSYTKIDIARMSPEEQLELAARYIKYWRDENAVTGNLTLGDLYLLVFAPAKMKGGSDDTVLYERGTENYEANKSLDTDQTDGGITKKELADRAYKALEEGLKNENTKTFSLTGMQGDNHVYEIDIAKKSFVKTNDPGADKKNHIFYVYNGKSLLGYHIMIMNSSGLVDFPFGGPNWERFGTRDAGGDNFADPEAAASALGFFYDLPSNGVTDTLYYNDISAFDQRNIGHKTHRTGLDFDIRYPGVDNSPGKKTWKDSRDHYGSEDSFVSVLESVLKVATDWGFENNYAYKAGINYTRNAAFDVHQDHFHIGYKK